MQILKVVKNKTNNETHTAIQWTGKNEDELLSISSFHTGCKSISTYPLLNWCFFRTRVGELLVRKNGWLVMINGDWHTFTGGQFKLMFRIVGDIECPEYADNEE